MRYPDRGQAQDLGKHVVGQTAAQVGQQNRAAAGAEFQRRQCKADPSVVRVQPRGGHDHGFADLHVGVARRSQVGLHVLAQTGHVGAHHKAHVHVGVGAGRNGVDREVRVAGAVGQHLQGVPGNHALGRAQARLAPVGVHRRVARVAAKLQTLQSRPHVGWYRWRSQGRHPDAAAAVHQAGDGVGQHRAGVAQQAAPVARMVGTFTQVQAQVEVGHAA